MGGKIYHVYILTNAAKMLYTGVTGNLVRRIGQHKKITVPGFTERFNLTRLVYFEAFGDIRAAIIREKQIKGWLRSKKIALIEASNPDYCDLSLPWFPPRDRSRTRSTKSHPNPA